MITRFCDACGQAIEGDAETRKLSIANLRGSIPKRYERPSMHRLPPPGRNWPPRPIPPWEEVPQHVLQSADLCFDCADKIIAIIEEQQYKPTEETTTDTTDTTDETTTDATDTTTSTDENGDDVNG